MPVFGRSPSGLIGNLNADEQGERYTGIRAADPQRLLPGVHGRSTMNTLFGLRNKGNLFGLTTFGEVFLRVVILNA